MKKSEELSKLFNDWKESAIFKRNGKEAVFMPDGIVSDDEYENAPIKILFMLKDVNNANPDIIYGRGICDEVLKSTNSGQTWNRIAEWAMALTDESGEFDDVSSKRKDKSINEYFKKVGLMNIKKAAGIGNANYNELIEAVQNEKDFIIREINICSPDIIVTCGTDVFDILVSEGVLSDLSDLSDYKPIEKNEFNYKRAGIFTATVNGHNVTVFRYRHPNRASAKNTFADMVRLKELLKNEK